MWLSFIVINYQNVEILNLWLFGPRVCNKQTSIFSLAKLLIRVCRVRTFFRFLRLQLAWFLQYWNVSICINTENTICCMHYLKSNKEFIFFYTYLILYLDRGSINATKMSFDVDIELKLIALSFSIHSVMN